MTASWRESPAILRLTLSASRFCFSKSRPPLLAAPLSLPHYTSHGPALSPRTLQAIQPSPSLVFHPALLLHTWIGRIMLEGWNYETAAEALYFQQAKLEQRNGANTTCLLGVSSSWCRNGHTPSSGALLFDSLKPPFVPSQLFPTPPPCGFMQPHFRLEDVWIFVAFPLSVALLDSVSACFLPLAILLLFWRSGLLGQNVFCMSLEGTCDHQRKTKTTTADLIHSIPKTIPQMHPFALLCWCEFDCLQGSPREAVLQILFCAILIQGR